MELENAPIALSVDDFDGSILFIEDIPEFFSPDSVATFFRWLGNKGFLQKINGVIIGKLKENNDFSEHSNAIKNVIGGEVDLQNMPVLYGLNFGHTSPIFILPYGVEAEINCVRKSFEILESGVV